MIAGIGTDIVSIDRIRATLARRGQAFAQRILTPAELHRFQQADNPVSFLAKRFAAKEAAAKALGTGIGKLSFHHLEVSNDPLGAPLLTFSGYAAALQRQRQITAQHLSLADEIDNAVAFVVLETGG